MKYGLIGQRLCHSFSAEIHKQLFGYDYELLELQPDQLAPFLQRREFFGINVTMPYKEAVIPYLDFVDDMAQKIGAVNTVINRNGKLYGYNTDYLGLKALIDYAGISPKNKTVLVLGSGGTSRTAMAVAESLGARCYVQVSRFVKEGCITYSEAKALYSDAEIIINTTPCGMYPNIGESAVDLLDFPMLHGVIDVVYNPLRTKLICDAMAIGIPSIGGLYMLVAQAAFAGSLFTNQENSIEAVNRVYKQLIAQKQNIVLIGMPGCGKTTVGKLLSRATYMDFVDTDEVIVSIEGRSITDIFSSDGEAYFRESESAVIQQLSTYQGFVIATGGGAVLEPKNVSMLRENGRIYFLDRSLERLVATDDRPLSSTNEALEQLFKERYDLYCAACDCHIDANQSVEDILRQIREDLVT